MVDRPHHRRASPLDQRHRHRWSQPHRAQGTVLNLIAIDPIPSYVWHQDMVDFADRIRQHLIGGPEGNVPECPRRLGKTLSS